MYVLSDETCQILEKFAEAGGIIVFTPRTGVKDVFNTVVGYKLPGLAAKMSGIEIEEIVSMAEDQLNAVQFCLPQLDEKFSISFLADVIEPKGAEVIARYLGDFYAGKPAATVNAFGSGKVIYIGFMGDQDLFTAIARWISGLLENTAPLETPKGIEVVTRWQGEQKLIFLLNHLAEEKEISLKTVYHELIADKDLSGRATMPAYGVFILTEK